MSASGFPRDWTVAELGTLRAPGEYSLVGGPFGSDLTAADYQDEPGVPVIRGTNLGGETGRFVDDGFVYVSERKADALRRNMAFPGDVVFTQRGTLGQVALIPSQPRFSRYVISQSQMKLTPDATKLDSRFLFYYFRSPSSLERISSRALTTGVPHINLGILKAFPVSYPHLAEQRRIAEVLDRAEALRAKRRAALAQLDDLTQAIFLDLFGDHTTILEQWPTKKLGELLDFLTSGSRGWAEYYAESGDLFIRIQNVRHDELALDDVTYVNTPDTAEAKRTRVQPGDVLLSITADLGRTAVVPEGIGAAFINQHLSILRTKSLVPRFLSAYLSSPVGQRQVFSRNRQGVKAGLNFDDIRSFVIPFPPLVLQQDFARRIAAVEKLKAAHRASLAELDALFSALQHRAFRGEL